MSTVVRRSVSALVCLLVAAIIVVAVPAPHAAEPVAVGYSRDPAALAARAPYPAVAPAGLPGSWQPVSSGLAGNATWADLRELAASLRPVSR